MIYMIWRTCPGLDLYSTDAAQHFKTAAYDLDHDLQ